MIHFSFAQTDLNFIIDADKEELKSNPLALRGRDDHY